ncbi:DUF885 domain-containing protein [Aliidiomarina taiwanensis]|uniref:DUF885 domain-containing protein n=1 Tax=Aliidiomarina taiwanensis TaxID=946228 RepID=A0A432X9W7_9GAMM|nr:DUF885 domain-containing protein [Aliidiomarina taiwanensis]RUO44213.1 DUF885 domain-containing protein [Aliidiomarina taiwanensis]
MKPVVLSALCLWLLVACTPVEKLSHSTEELQQSELLADIFEDYFYADLALDPLQATYVGETQFNGELANTFSDTYRSQRQLLEEEFLMALDAVNYAQLSDADKLSYDLFQRERKIALERLQFPTHLLPLNQMYNYANQLARLGSGESAQPFDTYEDYQNWLNRMRAIPDIFLQIQANLQQGLATDVTQPRIIMQRVLEQIRAHVVEDVATSLYFQPLANFPEGFTQAQRTALTEAYVQVIENQVVPAYRALAEYIESEYIPRTRTTDIGLSHLPQGKEWYAFEVKRQTTTNLTPDEIHALGLAEVARIHQAIADIMDDVGFAGDLAAFFEFTRDNPQFHYASPEAMLADYQDFAAQVEARVLDLFHEDMLPQAGYEIRRVEPFREQTASSGSYEVPAEDGSRPGIFYLNTYGLSARPTWAKGPLTLHEAIPGHHYQVALQREMTNLPRFRRYNVVVAFAEGWGLYTESLGDEFGLYDSYDRYGQLIAELWRSIRLVVDTGIHWKGWSKQQVLDYMYANAPVKEARAVSEAERFIVLPGQALAYKVGMLKIHELRQRAQQRLADKFDVRDFHREVLRHGSIPLSVLEREIERWLDSETSD